MERQQMLSELREGIGLTQKEFAKIVGISDKTLWSYEQDSSNIPNRLLSTILYLFDLNYDQIFLGRKYDLIVQRRKMFLDRVQEEVKK